MPIRITIGRNPKSTIVVPETYNTVSNEHADIFLNAKGELIFEDHSSNGTVINGQKIQSGSVQIFKDSDVRLADKYQLNWNELLQYFPELKCPTVAQKIVTGEAQDPHKTIRFNSNNVPSGNVQQSQGNQTMKFDSGGLGVPGTVGNQQTSSGSNQFGGTLNEENEKDKPKPPKQHKKTPWGVLIGTIVGTLLLVAAIAYFVFDDAIRNFI